MQIKNKEPNFPLIDFFIKITKKKLSKKNTTQKDNKIISSYKDCLSDLASEIGTSLPLLSIVIPNYNSGEYLSCLIEDLKSNMSLPYEIIIVDDGSTDCSFSKARNAYKNKKNIIFIESTSKGAGAARNQGAKLIRGVFSCFIDADDLVNAHELCDAVKQANIANNDLLLLPYNILYVEKNIIENMYSKDFEAFNCIRNSKKITDKYIHSLKITGFPWIRLIKTKLLQDKNISFNETIVHNDIQFHWQSICCASNIDVYSYVVCTHRKFETGSLSSIRDERRFAVFEALSITEKALKHNHIFNLCKSEWILFKNHLIDWNEKNINIKNISEYNILKIKHGKIDLKLSSHSDVQAQSLPIVSVVTVTRNILGTTIKEQSDNLRHFKRMLQSVLDQSYGRDNIEHVIIDGESTDGTVNLIKNLFASRLVDFFISEKDSGVYNAMNKSLKYIKGDYVLFLNAHDYLEPDALNALVSKALETDADYVFGNSVTIDENNKPTGGHKGNINRILYGMPYCHQAALYSTRALNKVNYDENFSITVWKFAIDIYSNLHKFAYIDINLANFREGGLSTSENHRRKYMQELMRVRNIISDNILQIPSEDYLNLSKIARNGFNSDCSLSYELYKSLGNKYFLREHKNPFLKDFMEKICFSAFSNY